MSSSTYDEPDMAFDLEYAKPRDRRKRLLSDADVEKLALELFELQVKDHACRFGSIEPQDLSEAIKFFKAFNDAWVDSKKTMKNTLIVLAMTLIFTLLGYGIVHKLKGQ